MMRNCLLCFHIRRDELRMWSVSHGANNRVIARAPFKDLALELARRVGRSHAPCRLVEYDDGGQMRRSWVYRSALNHR